MNKSLCVILVVVAAGCHKKPNEEVTRLNGPNYRPSAAVTSTINVAATQGANRAADAAAIGTLRQTAIYEYGPSSGPVAAPSHASLGPDGSILFVNETSPEVFRITADGKIGSVLPEHLPPDFRLRGPSGIMPLGNRQWVVTDRTTRLKVFSLQADQLVPVRVLPIADATDACLMGNSIVVRGDEKPLHRYNLDDGTNVRRYGKVFSHPSRLVRILLADGLVGCRDEASPIVTMSTAFSFVYGYASDGALRWLTKVEGLENKPMSFVKGEHGEGAVRNEGANYDLPTRLLPLDGDRVLFQFVRIQREPAAPTQVHSIVLSAQTGEGEYIGTTLPRVVGGTWPTLITVDTESRRVAIQIAETRHSESRIVASNGAGR